MIAYIDVPVRGRRGHGPAGRRLTLTFELFDSHRRPPMLRDQWSEVPIGAADAAGAPSGRRRRYRARGGTGRRRVAAAVADPWRRRRRRRRAQRSRWRRRSSTGTLWIAAFGALAALAALLFARRR
jgi:hypothetical protein